MQHLLAMERAQALGNLLDDAAHGLNARLRIVDHPLRQRLPVDEFGDDVEEVPLALRQARLQHVRAVDPPRHPLLHHEPLQVVGIVAQIDRRDLDGDHGVGLDVDRKIDVAAAGAVQFADDPVAVEHRPRLQQWRQRQFARLPEHFAGRAVGQFVDADDLDGQVVPAAESEGQLDDGLGGLVQIVGAILDRPCHRAVADMLVDTVGHQQESVAPLDLERQIIDLDLRIGAERAAEIALLRRNDDAVIVGELFERVAGKTIDPAIADVKDVPRGRLDDHGAQGADVSPVHVMGVLAAPRLRVQPGIGRLQHALRRRPHRPGFRRAVIVGQKPLDRRLGCDPADLAAADAVRQRDGDALQAEQRLVWNQNAVKILIGLLATFVRMLPDRYFQFARHVHDQGAGLD